MEEWIRAKIEKTKKRIAEVEREIEAMERLKSVVNEHFLYGYRKGLEHELETLEDALFAWEQLQKYGDVNHLL